MATINYLLFDGGGDFWRQRRQQPESEEKRRKREEREAEEEREKREKTFMFREDGGCRRLARIILD